MKKILLFALGLYTMSSAAVYAQEKSVGTVAAETYEVVSESLNRGLDKVAENVAPFKLGVQAGLNVSRFSHSGYDPMAGFHLGLTAIFDASEVVMNSYVRTSLLFQRKGSRLDFAGSDDARFHVGYLELPVRAGYSYLLNSDWTLIGETGPYVALGIGGKAHDLLVYDGWGFPVQKDVKFFNDLDARRFDFGWGLHLGTIFAQNHQLLLGWDFGFVNMTDDLLQNRNFSLSYAYYFR